MMTFMGYHHSPMFPLIDDDISGLSPLSYDYFYR